MTRAKGRNRAAAAPRRTRRRDVAAIAVLVVAAGIVYADSLRGAFVFDDRYTIVANPALGDLSDLRSVLLGVQGSPSGGRPLTSLSLDLNARLAGRRPVAFHAVNIGIHLAAGIALFALLRLALLRAAPGSPLHDAAHRIALAVALLWLVHPLTTEAVTYVSQRAESLMALCFILAVYLALRGFAAERPTPWFRGAALASVLAVLAKEVGVVAPLVILLFDAAVESHGLRRALSRHRALYAGLSISWLVAGMLQLAAPRGASVSFSGALGPLGYAARQPTALLTYLKLVFWPSPLVFDYGDPPPLPPALHVAAAAAVLAALLAGSILALRRRPLAGVAGCSFFLILAPTSTFVPILTEVTAEHRMYLPLACVLALVVGGVVTGHGWAIRRGLVPARLLVVVGWAIIVVAAFALGAVTWRRNRDYRSELALWRDTVAKEPANPRALNNLGMATLESGDPSAAATLFRRVVAAHPDYFEANGGLAVALERMGRAEEALPFMRRAAELQPESDSAAGGVVRLLTETGRADDALAAAKSWVERSPLDANANAAYGSLLLRAGRASEAAAYLRRAHALGASQRAGSR
jgi:Tfp pilus assembly protein PilF